MPRILLVYASAHGQTRKIADTIAAQLRHAGATVELADALAGGVPSPDGYDMVVLGSGVHMARHAPDVIEYIVRNRTALARVPTGFFSVSMAASSANGGPESQGYLKVLFTTCSWTPGRAAAFAGGIPYRRYNPIFRFIMKQISKRAGHTTDTSRNHEMTDWDQVVDFADLLATDVLADGLAHEDGPMTAPLPATMH